MRTFLPTTALLVAAVALAAVCSVSPTAAALAPATTVRPQLLVGGWKKIDVGNARIQELGSWAVAQHVSMAHDRLKFAKVAGGEKQVVAGTNYRLTIRATDENGEIGTYGAAIHEDASTQARKLISFVPAN